MRVPVMVPKMEKVVGKEVRGYDELYDHRVLTDDIEHVDLIVQLRPKPNAAQSNDSSPVGGVRTDVDSRYYKTIRSRITGGAKLEQDVPRVTSIDVFLRIQSSSSRRKQQMTVAATFADGTVRDVSREAFIESGNIEVIEVISQWMLTVLRRGEGPVLIRYEGNYAATTPTVMGDRSGFAWEEPEHYNYIDKHVQQTATRESVTKDICTDEEFVRRVYIDVTGLPPTASQVREFLETVSVQE